MNKKIIRKSTLKSYKNKKFFLSSAIALRFLYPTNVISQSLIKAKLNEINNYSNKSFITKAVEKTGSSVVTIDTQRYVKKRKFQNHLHKKYQKDYIKTSI